MTLSKSNKILPESKPEIQKSLICSKSRESTAESSGVTRFSNTSVEVQQTIVTKCTKWKIIASKHEKQNQTSRNIGQYVYYKYLVTKL